MRAEDDDPVWPALVASSLIGLTLGVLFPAWHVAIEPAQVAAGIVTYPPDNPYALYQTRVWNLWHQLLAPLLAAGVPERTLTFALSGVVGAITFVSMTTFASAMGARTALAIAAPLLTWFFNPMIMRWGFNYPILLVGHGHTYGMVGLAWLALAIGTLGIGRFGTGAFLIGMAPALHASLGAWLALLAGVCGLTMFGTLRPQLPAIVRGGLLGIAVAAASFGWHQLGRGPEPTIDPELAKRYLNAFVYLWDAHRFPPALDWNLSLLIVCCALALLLVTRRRRDLAAGPALALRILLAAALLGAACAAQLQLLPPRKIPDLILVAMPTRILNLPVLVYVPIVVGVLSRFRGDALAGGALALLAIAAALWPRARVLQYVGVPAVGLAAVALVWREKRWLLQPRFERVLAGVTLLAIAAAIAQMLWVSLPSFPARAARIRDRSNDPALAAASRVEGVLAVAPSVFTSQAETRRPILLEPGGLDMLPYALAGGPAIERILADLYGIDFFNPPGSAIRQGVVPYGMAKRIWEDRAPVGWRATASRLGFTHVLVPALWKIKLPAVARSDVYALYRVPIESTP